MSNTKLKLSLILLAICLLCITVSTVLANDNIENITDINSTNKIVEVSTFNELNEKIKSGKNYIVLKNDINGLNGIQNGIDINYAVTIDGNGYSINAKNEGNFFKINENGNVILKNIILKNGKYGVRGIAPIYNKGSLEIYNSTFINNNYQKYHGILFGGAILNKGILKIYNSTFKNNNATNGGAILNLKKLEIYNSTFKNNNAIVGGAILTYGSLKIYNSTFKNNTGLQNDAISSILPMQYLKFEKLIIDTNIFAKNEIFKPTLNKQIQNINTNYLIKNNKVKSIIIPQNIQKNIAKIPNNKYG